MWRKRPSPGPTRRVCESGFLRPPVHPRSEQRNGTPPEPMVRNKRHHDPIGVGVPQKDLPARTPSFSTTSMRLSKPIPGCNRYTRNPPCQTQVGTVQMVQHSEDHCFVIRGEGEMKTRIIQSRPTDEKAAPGNAIEITGLTKRYDDDVVLDGLRSRGVIPEPVHDLQDVSTTPLARDPVRLAWPRGGYRNRLHPHRPVLQRDAAGVAGDADTVGPSVRWRHLSRSRRHLIGVEPFLSRLRPC
jgi:hypothetical protein